MNAISIYVGALFAAVAIVTTDLFLAKHGSSFILMGWAGMPLFLAIAATAAWLGRIIILVMMVLAWRPRSAICWTRPSQHARFTEWCSSSWDIRTPSSRQIGHRVLGLNLALYGAMPAMRVATPDRPTTH